MKRQSAEIDKRISPRTKTLMPGHVLDPRIGIVANCLVRDFSAGGAKLEFHQSFALPAAFWLKIAGDGTLRYCTAKWQSKRHVGVEFTRDKLLRIAADEIEALRLGTSFAARNCKVV